MSVWGTVSLPIQSGVRLRRSDVQGPGYRRRRAGRGFAYYDEDGAFADSGAVVTVDRTAERPAVRVTGAIDEHTAETVRIRLLEASRGGTTAVELDLEDVVLFSSSAVRVVLAIARIARDEGWRLAVHAPDGGVTRHILEISGLTGLVDLH